jgi:hypothetical protein
MSWSPCWTSTCRRAPSRGRQPRHCRLDLIIADYNQLELWSGAGDGTFALNSTIASISGSFGIFSVAVGDFNNDQKDDIAFAGGYSSGGNYDNSAVTILLSQGNGQFSPAFNAHFGHTLASFDYNSPPIPSGMVLADLNNDGNLDVVVSDWYDNVWALTGNGDGTLTALYGFGDSNNPGAVVVGDVNNDGTPDIVAADTTKPSLHTFLHK